MAWIEVIEPEQAEGDLAELYEAIGAARGGVARVHQIQSLNPRAMKAHLELYKSVVFARSTLTRIERERIAVVVSSTNQCAYCIAHHAAALAGLGDDPGVINALGSGDWHSTSDDPSKGELLDARSRALLDWARESTLAPHLAAKESVQSLKDVGFDDRAILDATLTVGYFCFVNRLVLLLGVSVEEDFEDTCGSDLARSEVG
jgi:uncharacterized peroxidase-related enzyme